MTLYMQELLQEVSNLVFAERLRKRRALAEVVSEVEAADFLMSLVALGRSMQAKLQLFVKGKSGIGSVIIHDGWLEYHINTSVIFSLAPDRVDWRQIRLVDKESKLKTFCEFALVDGIELSLWLTD